VNIYYVIFITLVAAILASLSQILFKTGITKRIRSMQAMIALLRQKRVLLGLTGYVTSLVIYLFALSGTQLSLVYPIFASTFIFVTLLSAVLLKEKISLLRAVGVAVVFAGIIMVTMTA